MKAEINNENKAKFFALYWGQQIVSHSEYPQGSTNRIDGAILRKLSEEDYFLYLKPLSQISDEDAIEVGDMLGWLVMPQFIQRKVFECLNNRGYRYSFNDVSIVYDYIRSKGYALPWMGLSVEEMVEAGWIKLKE